MFCALGAAPLLCLSHTFSVQVISVVWRIGLPILVVAGSASALVTAFRSRDRPAPMSRTSVAFIVLIWLELAGDAAFGDHRPTLERQWKGSAAILLVLAGALQLWRYRRRDRASTDRVPPASATQSVRHDGPATPVTMPSLGEGVNEVTVTHWLKQVGDHVEAGEPLVEVSTDKVDTEIPADTSGDLCEIRVQAGGTAPVGTIIAMIEPRADRPSEASTAPDRLGSG